MGDIRAVGSGNIGATNVLAHRRRDIAALTLLLDAGKGAVAVLALRYWAGELPALIAGVAAVFGHCTSPWVGFKGGKGVATGLGVILAWSWLAGLGLLRRLAGGGVPLEALQRRLRWRRWRRRRCSCTLGGWQAAVAGLVVAAIAFVRHRANIARLFAGTEPRIGQH